MRRKRSKGDSRNPVKTGRPKLDATTLELASTLELAAALEQIASMDALPLAPSPLPRRRRRRCAT